jgi:holo-ACP synthase/triphosphoribosyl-dephospho-CoA synthase
VRAFDAGVRALHEVFAAENIAVVHRETVTSDAGQNHFAVVEGAPGAVKKITVGLEDEHPLGRLFDYDVFGGDGEKLSRATGAGGDGAGGGEKMKRATGARISRPCLVCDNDGFVCARSRAHPIGEVVAAANRIILDWLRDEAACRAQGMATRALLSELAVTPKPGLVDRANNGAHEDMDFFTFIDSTASIAPFFAHCARYAFDHPELEPPELLAALRLPGKIAERRMKAATAGVNTHQGAIFSLGILSAAYGRSYLKTENPSIEMLLALSSGMVNAASAAGFPGAAAEAAQGFPTVLRYALPILKTNPNRNDAGAAALLALLAHTEDTNIIRRAGKSTLEEIHRRLQNAPVDPAALDAEFIARHLSPGGTADLLGVAFFLLTADAGCDILEA